MLAGISTLAARKAGQLPVMYHITEREGWFEFCSISAKPLLEQKGKLS